VRVQASWSPEAFRPESLTGGAGGWELPVPWGPGEVLRLALEAPEWVDTLRLQWQEGAGWEVPSKVALYADGVLQGRYAGNQPMPVQAAVQFFWVQVEECPSMQSICEAGVPTPPCLYRRTSGLPMRLEEVALVAGNAALPLAAVPGEALQPSPPQPEGLPGYLFQYLGYAQNAPIQGLALHPDGTFAQQRHGHSCMGGWQAWPEGKKWRIALQGYCPQPKAPQPCADTLLFDPQSGFEGQLASFPLHLPDQAFVRLRDLRPDFAYDLRYATENNFMKQQVYDCAECWLRYEAALALLQAQEQVLAQGYRLLLYDCYRPLSVQQRMWDIFPNPTYVANPHQGIGSIHNRGGAVDIGLASPQGEELDLGTPFDFFGPAAHQDYDLAKLPEAAAARRKLLRGALEQAGFMSIRTEWWHYSFQNKTKFEVANIPISCD
jgi:D-alanyl-D-alanine dipeptidase